MSVTALEDLVIVLAYMIGIIVVLAALDAIGGGSKSGADGACIRDSRRRRTDRAA
jgi:hypothetical protein